VKSSPVIGNDCFFNKLWHAYSAQAPIALLAIDYTRLHLSNKSQKLMVSSLMTVSMALWIVFAR
jgi:hypothetical protein